MVSFTAFAEEEGAYFPGSPRHRAAVIPSLCASAKSTPPGADAMSMIVAELFTFSSTSAVTIKAGTVLRCV